MTPSTLHILPLVDFRFANRTFSKGDRVEISRDEALFLWRRGKVRIVPAPVPLAVPPPPPLAVPSPVPSPVFSPSIPFPDLRPHFHHVEWRIAYHSQGALVASDFTDKLPSDPVFGKYKECGFWTLDEVKILYYAACRVGGYWLDIGGLTGWTAAHIAAAGCHVASLDPMYSNREFRSRAAENHAACGTFPRVGLWTGTSTELFSHSTRLFDGIVIDGEHRAPQPLKDAINAAKRVKSNGVILLHDANNAGVQPAYAHLAKAGWKLKRYATPYGVVLCYRNGFVPPEAA